MEVTVIRGGQLTTVQDRGRLGFRAAGVPTSGPVDPFAFRVANLLVGNQGNEAALEITLAGPSLEFSDDTLVAVGGAQCGVAPSWRPWRVRAGERLDLGECRGGGRAYLAIPGGFTVEPVMGSRSTYLRATIGGFAGRALHAGDRLGAGQGKSKGPLANEAAFFVSASIRPAYSTSPSIRVVRGAQADEFGGGLCGPEFKVSARSDRMGIRLTGTQLVRASVANLLSTAVAAGTVQVPPDGQPIVLMADAQTLGGYPLAGHIASVDLPLIAQLRPGDSLHFSEVSVQEAQRLFALREKDLRQLGNGAAQRLKDWGN